MTMRERVIQRIKQLYSYGLDEIPIAYLNFKREEEGRMSLPDFLDDNGREVLKIDTVLNLMNDAELIRSLESQICQDCR